MRYEDLTSEQKGLVDQLHDLIAKVRREVYSDGDDNFLVEWVVATVSVVAGDDSVTSYGYITPLGGLPLHRFFGLLEITHSEIEGQVRRAADGG